MEEIFLGVCANIIRPKAPLSWLDPGAFGTLGVGAGFALAAKLVHPDADVWLLWGDGSSGYSIAEYDTFVRHNCPVLAVIGNDACWTQIEREQVHILKDNVACPLSYCNYHTVAEGFGGYGSFIDDKEKVENTLKVALSKVRAGIPVVVNAHIGSSNFREGSISV